MNYYVYIYHREDGTPYYVGKGSGNRFKSVTHNCKVPPMDLISFPVVDTTEEWSLFMEMELIDLYGRLDDGTGILENRTDGGDNPPKNGKHLDQKPRQDKIKEFYKSNPEELIKRGRKISETKKSKGHITSKQTKERHQQGDFYTEEGLKKVKDICYSNYKKTMVPIRCIETGQEWEAIKQCARDLHMGINVLRKSLRTGVSIRKGTMTFEYVNP